MKPTGARGTCRLAVLIDAENISARYVAPLLGEVAGLGTASLRRIYGDWTQPDLGGWKRVLHVHSIIPIQQFRLTSGKNSTDCALIIDAMDILHTGRFDGFCLVSSDSDFTRLACRIREAGLIVYGFGEAKTPASFAGSCDRFFALESLGEHRAPAGRGIVSPIAGASPVGVANGGNAENGHAAGPSGASGSGATAIQKRPATAAGSASPKPPIRDEDLLGALRAAYDAVSGEDGWAPLTTFGARLRCLRPGFDPRTYGCKKLGDLIEGAGIFEIRKEKCPKDCGVTHWFIRAR